LLSNTTPRSVIESTRSRVEEPIAYKNRVGLKDLVNVMDLHLLTFRVSSFSLHH
jgi:hypothetical protein